MSAARKRLYRAELGTRVDARDGCSILSWFGLVTECGDWVEQGPMRWRRDETWHETEQEAEAALADRIASIGLACSQQANRLRYAGREAKAARRLLGDGVANAAP